MLNYIRANTQRRRLGLLQSASFDTHPLCDFAPLRYVETARLAEIQFFPNSACSLAGNRFVKVQYRFRHHGEGGMFVGWQCFISRRLPVAE